MQIKDISGSVPDYRSECALKLHLLSDILMISLCAVLSRAENDEQIATYGEQKKELLSTFLSLPNGIAFMILLDGYFAIWIQTSLLSASINTQSNY